MRWGTTPRRASTDRGGVNIVVIGGAGFIGSHLVDRLLAEDHSVDVVDNLSTGSLANLAEARTSGGALKFHHLDAATKETDSSIGARRPDVIYHLALLPRGQEDPTAMGESFASTLAVLEAARRHAVTKVVVALPASVIYGHPAANDLPIKEGEPSQLVARGVRGVVARAIIDLLVNYRDLHAIEFAALAVADVYGPRQRSDGGVVAAFVDAARTGEAPTIRGSGRQTRDLLYVDDAVDALVRASERGGGLVINIGTGVQTPIAELWAKIASSIDGAAALEPTISPAHPDELHRFAIAAVRARIHLAWSPWTDLDDGLARVVSQ